MFFATKLWDTTALSQGILSTQCVKCVGLCLYVYASTCLILTVKTWLDAFSRRCRAADWTESVMHRVKFGKGFCEREFVAICSSVQFHHWLFCILVTFVVYLVKKLGHFFRRQGYGCFLASCVIRFQFSVILYSMLSFSYDRAVFVCFILFFQQGIKHGMICEGESP